MLRNSFRNFSLLFILVLVPLIIVSWPLIEVKAQPSGGIQDPLGGSGFTTLIGNIIDWLADIGIGIAIIMIVYSGLLFMTAAGNEEKIAKAKKALIWSLIGLAVLITGKSWIALIKNILGG